MGRSYTQLHSLDISLAPDQIESFMNGHSEGLNPNTMGWSLVFLHEMQHSALGIGATDPNTFGAIGDIESMINEIRSELGDDYGIRMSYGYAQLSDYKYVPFDIYSKKQIEKGEEPTYGQFIKY